MFPRNRKAGVLLFFSLLSFIVIFYRASTPEQNRNQYEAVLEIFPEEENVIGKDEIVDGKPILSYFKQLAMTVDILSRRSDKLLKLFAAYEYIDHFSIVLSSQERMGSSVYCRYLDENNSEIHNPVETIIYPYFVAYCSWRNGTKRISLTRGIDEKIQKHNILEMVGRTFKNPEHHLAYCLAPIYGDEPKWLHIVELIEHYKLQGVTRFFAYVRKISEYDLKLLKSYEEVEIIDVPPTIDDVISQQILAVSDCHLRSRKFSKWSIFSDIDERFIMTDATLTIDQFLRNISKESIGAIAFPQRWIMKRALLPAKYESDEQIAARMPTLEWHETTGAAIKGNPACSAQTSCWAKDVIQNDKVIRMLVHEVERFYPGAEELFLNDTVGYIRHYRDVHMQSWEANNINLLKKFGPFSNTSYPSALSKKLFHNVISKLHDVYQL